MVFAYSKLHHAAYGSPTDPCVAQGAPAAAVSAAAAAPTPQCYCHGCVRVNMCACAATVWANVLIGS